MAEYKKGLTVQVKGRLFDALMAELERRTGDPEHMLEQTPQGLARELLEDALRGCK